MAVGFRETMIGWLGVEESNGSITEIFFTQGATGESHETPLIKEAFAQLDEYFSGKRTTFALPLAPVGTEFQQRVWRALQSIPYGETRSYKEVAEQIGNVKAVRAVGMANNRNPIAIVIPCHRVIGADGTLVGYGGGLHIKVKLLQLEKGSG